MKGAGLEAVWKKLESWARGLPQASGDTPYLISLRQEQALDGLLGALDRADIRLSEGGALEIAALHLQEGMSSVRELTGEGAPQEVLEAIFSRFCIGK